MNPALLAVAAGVALALLFRRQVMHNCSDEILGYHDDAVTLPQAERDQMRQRRDTNRIRLKNGLKKAEKPGPSFFKSQGSYAMKTMTQHPDRDYDIDDGVYFDKDELVGARGAELSALDARQMVRDAIDDGSFKMPPEVRTNCVRVYYGAGYHVDIPVYRRVETTNMFGTVKEHYELAGSEWTRSDARNVTGWFEKHNDDKSPNKTNGGQLRRITRDLKRFTKSRGSWHGRILSGFGVTVLVTECFHADSAREDVALYKTMKAIKDRLDRNLVVNHPVTPGDTITTGSDDAKARFLRDKLGEALDWLNPVLEDECERKAALKCWDKVFSTKYFSEQFADEEESGRSAAISVGILKDIGSSERARRAVQKEGGGRYA